MVQDRHICSSMIGMGYRGLPKEEALAMRSHIAKAFAEWIGRSAHFNTVPLLLEAGRQCAGAAQERCRQ